MAPSAERGAETRRDGPWYRQPKSPLDLLKSTVSEFFEDDCPRMAAALSYYTVFSLPPLLVVLMMVASAAFDAETIERALLGQVGDLIGPEGGRQLGSLLENLEQPGGGPLRTAFGIGALLFGATAAFANLQASLNRVWEIAPDPRQHPVRNFLVKRVFSFAMILGIGFLLLVSLILSATLTFVGGQLSEWLPGGMSLALLHAADNAISFVVIGLLFGAIFKVLPDAAIRWRDVSVGAAVTALLYSLGKMGIGFYLGRADPGSAYGAAGSLAVLLLWVYLSANILLLGAEFTQVWSRKHGKRIIPEKGARRLRIERVEV